MLRRSITRAGPASVGRRSDASLLVSAYKADANPHEGQENPRRTTRRFFSSNNTKEAKNNKKKNAPGGESSTPSSSSASASVVDRTTIYADGNDGQSKDSSSAVIVNHIPIDPVSQRVLKYLTSRSDWIRRHGLHRGLRIHPGTGTFSLDFPKKSMLEGRIWTSRINFSLPSGVMEEQWLTVTVGGALRNFQLPRMIEQPAQAAPEAPEQQKLQIKGPAEMNQDEIDATTNDESNQQGDQQQDKPVFGIDGIQKATETGVVDASSSSNRMVGHASSMYEDYDDGIPPVVEAMIRQTDLLIAESMQRSSSS